MNRMCENWSEYYSCKECEDEVNRKGHLTKLQEAVHVKNVKNVRKKVMKHHMMLQA